MAQPRSVETPPPASLNLRALAGQKAAHWALIMVLGLSLLTMAFGDTAARRFPWKTGQWLDQPVVSRVAFDFEPASAKASEQDDGHFEAQTVLLPAAIQLGPNEIAMLATEHRAWRNMDAASLTRILRALGTGLLTALLTSSIFLYLFATGSRAAKNPMRATALCALLGLSLGLSVAFSGLMANWQHAPYAFPLVAVALVCVVAYDRRMALAVGGVLAALTMGALRLPASTGLVLFAGVATAALPLRAVRQRTDLVLAGLWSGIGMAIASLAVSLSTRPMGVSEIAEDALKDAAGAFGLCLATGMIIQGVLPLIERAFGITTAMTLKDLNDASHPLLQRLAKDAPGTYQHSLRLADLAEAAAEAIGADPLLCRVSAMYHDIGKAQNPMFFVENQGGGPNPHDQLVPTSSAAIIQGHVTDGLRLAREHRLPQPIIHAIASHHGTTLVEYFHRAALRRHDLVGGTAPEEADYRYGGPKPQSAEAAILMLCDGIESVARSLLERTPEKFAEIVHAMVKKRMLDGQLDECPLTTLDLRRIEEACVKSLMAMHHGRVAYPGEEAAAQDAQNAQGPQGEKDAQPEA